MQAREQLRQWLTDEGRKHFWLAKQVKVDNATLSRWLTGDTTPHPLARAELERITGIPATSWAQT